ncbi:MAG: hypothetical protein ACT4NY_30690 [Pseudonocardiales bacterium]
MSYGNDDVASGLQNADNGAAPLWYTQPEARGALAERDIGAVYGILYRGGVPQREIARCTGQSQSEVSEIMHGTRRVREVQVLERIADGLEVPWPLLRLLKQAPDEDGTYPTEGGPTEEGGPDPEVDEEMKRRVLIAATSLAALGQVVKEMGEVVELALPCSGQEPLPTRLTMAHVRARGRLVPLAAALEARPGADAKELARTARRVATIRA